MIAASFAVSIRSRRRHIPCRRYSINPRSLIISRMLCRQTAAIVRQAVTAAAASSTRAPPIKMDMRKIHAPKWCGGTREKCAAFRQSSHRNHRQPNAKVVPKMIVIAAAIRSDRSSERREVRAACGPRIIVAPLDDSITRMSLNASRFPICLIAHPALSAFAIPGQVLTQNRSPRPFQSSPLFTIVPGAIDFRNSNPMEIVHQNDNEPCCTS
jgi:hypothetical protein